jgi:hypothetical protein
MRLNPTQIFNYLYNLVCILCAVWAEMPPAALDVLPPKIKHYVTVGAMVAMWVKSHQNLFIAPNGAKLQGFMNVGAQPGVVSYATGPVAEAAPGTPPVPTEVKIEPVAPSGEAK